MTLWEHVVKLIDSDLYKTYNYDGKKITGYWTDVLMHDSHGNEELGDD